MFDRVVDMRPARYEREIVRTRTRYAKAADRFARALAEWQAEQVPIGITEEVVPQWTSRQRDASWRAADAFADLVTSHRAWEKLLQELGHPR
jgi:hypothetical protein